VLVGEVLDSEVLVGKVLVEEEIERRKTMREWAGPLADCFRRRDPHLPQKAVYRTPRNENCKKNRG
jgi:hypothetical protein